MVPKARTVHNHAHKLSLTDPNEKYNAWCIVCKITYRKFSIRSRGFY